MLKSQELMANFSSKRTSKWMPTLLIAIGVTYLGLILYIPTANVFFQAFKNGFSPFLESITDREFINAALLTLAIAPIVLSLNIIFGLCAAWAITRRKTFPGRTLLLSIIDLPFSISPVVAGMTIVLLYGKNGWFGSFFTAANIQIIFSLPGIIIATLFVSLPFVVREVIPVLEEIGSEQEEAARTLGANDWQIFWRVTLPNIRWGLLYGIVLTNARAMGEFGAVSVVSGKLINETQTLPLFVEDAYKEYETQSAYGAAVVLALLALVTLIAKEILERSTKNDRD
jgi:sulfate/thiosulfate transport system permease protein